MKKDYSTKKKAAIAALSIVAVCLAGGLFYYTGTMGGQPQETPVESTAPMETQVVVPEIKPEATPKTAQTDSNTSEADPSEIPSEPSQETAAPAGSETPAQSKPTDGKPKSPTEATPPSDPPAETNQGSGNSSNSTPEQPQGGEKQDGKIYVPGFGWIEDEGGGSDVHEAPNAGTGEPVGDM